MKKFVTFFLIVNILLGAFSVKALSESKLSEKFCASYDINGYNYSLSEGDKILVQRYFDKYDVSEKDADYISKKIDEAISEMRKSGVKDFSDFGKLPSSLRKKLKSLVLDVAANTSIKATTSKGTVIVYTPDGKVFAEVSKYVKDTGSNVSMIAIGALFISLIGTVLIVRNVKENA